MPAPAQKKGSIMQFLLIFATVYIGSQLLLRMFFPAQVGGETALTGVTLRAGNVTMGNEIAVTIRNGTATELAIPSRCPDVPLDVFYVTGTGALQSLRASELIGRCETLSPIAPGTELQVKLSQWKYSVFDRPGTYEVRFPGSGSGAVADPAQGTGASLQAVAPVRFVISEPGVFTKLFRTFISAPFLNFLIFVASLLPDHNLGIAIIVLTVVVKLLLFIPTKHALEGQKKMQILQPKLEALKEKYRDDPKRIQEETMKLWSEHKINPFQSCLPTLIQFPILIGLFYVIRDGSHLEVSRHLIYPMYQNLTWTFGTSFFGLDLLKPDLWVMPVLLVTLQFLQMKLSFAIQKRKTAKTDVIDVGAKDKKEKKSMSSQATQQNMMLYGLPLMIGFFAIQFPAAVSVYWGISTLFSIGQQILVNREHIRA